MKKSWMIMTVLILAFSILIWADDEEKVLPEELKTSSEKLSYALGMEIGTFLKGLSEEVDLPIFVRGLEDVFKDNECALTEAEAEEIRRAFRKDLEKGRVQKGQEIAERNRKEGKMFLEENKKKEGVLVTASGLQYTVLKQGDGAKPKATEMVNVHYRGTLTDGKEFDSSYKRGKPVSFLLNRVIPGWTEGLQLMPVGSKHRFFIPSNLGYGEKGSGQFIGPNATLVFDVELLGIQK